MSEIIKKIGLFGIGLIAIGQERLESFAAEMVVKGEMNKEEGKRFVNDVLIEKDRQIKEIGEMINQKIKDSIERSGFATKKDIENVNDRLDSLEKRLS